MFTTQELLILPLIIAMVCRAIYNHQRLLSSGRPKLVAGDNMKDLQQHFSDAKELIKDQAVQSMLCASYEKAEVQARYQS